MTLPHLPAGRRCLARRPGPVSVLKAGAEVVEHRLKNGLRVIVAERHADPVVSVLLFYRVGSRNERDTEAGMSHFLEHMMFKGTPERGKGEVDRLTTLLGGQNNAFTGYDHTAYWFELASDRWEVALDIEADRMSNLSFDPSEFDAEREVVLEELSMGRDDPWRILAECVEEALFHRHPYARPIIGYPHVLRSMTPDDMRAYYERFYHPGNATLVVCGDVQPEQALREVRKRFAKLPVGPAYEAVDAPRPPLEAPVATTRILTRWDDASRRLILAWPTIPVARDEDFVLDVALTILTSGRRSRLQRRLVLEERLATSIAGANDTRVEAGAFWLYAECAQDIDPRKLEEAILEEVERLALEKVTAAELKRAKAVLRASEAYDGESVTDVAEELGEWAVDADWRMAFDGGERTDRVTVAQVRAAVAHLLAPNRSVIGWCLPEGHEPVAPTRFS